MPLAAVCGEARDSMTRTRLPQHRRCGAVDSLQFLRRRLQHWPVVHIVEVNSLRSGSGVSLQWHDERGACAGDDSRDAPCGLPTMSAADSTTISATAAGRMPATWATAIGFGCPPLRGLK